jgi:sugar phosphate isomerase/epimerase
LKLGYNTWSMPTLSFSDAITHCARLGFDAVEVTVSEGWTTDVFALPPGAAQSWKRIAADAGIAITSLTANAQVLVHGEPWAAARERLTRSLALAAELQGAGERMPVSLTASGPTEIQVSLSVSSEEAWAANRALVVERFGDLADLAARAGVRVALEPHFATVVCNGERALEVLSVVASPSLGLNLDISHFAVQGLPIGEAIRTLGPSAVACEVKDQRGVAPDFQFLIPGEGDFDYVAFLRTLAGSGYDGSVAVEISVLRQRIAGYDPYAAAERSYAVLSDAFFQAGVARSGKSPQRTTV